MLIYSEPKQEHNATSSSATSNVFFATLFNKGLLNQAALAKIAGR